MPDNQQTKAFVEQMKKNAGKPDQHYTGEFGETTNKPAHEVDVPRRTPQEVHERRDEMVILDARPAEAYHDAEHMIWGAVRVDPDNLYWTDSQDPESFYVVYGQDANSDDAVRIAQHMIGRGLRYTAVLAGGWPAWQQADLPTQRKA
jgi:3-mercaptopyruvate sulfurtransferase SseA